MLGGILDYVFHELSRTTYVSTSSKQMRVRNMFTRAPVFAVRASFARQSCAMGSTTASDVDPRSRIRNCHPAFIAGPLARLMTISNALLLRLPHVLVNLQAQPRW
jgi:hypothetical protein